MLFAIKVLDEKMNMALLNLNDVLRELNLIFFRCNQLYLRYLEIIRYCYEFFRKLLLFLMMPAKCSGLLLLFFLKEKCR